MKKKTAKTKSVSSTYHTNKQFDVNRLHQVTSVSKVLAAVLFVALPFLAFVLGLVYENNFNIFRY